MNYYFDSTINWYNLYKFNVFTRDNKLLYEFDFIVIKLRLLN